MIKLLMTPTIDILAWKGNILFEQRYVGQFNDNVMNLPYFFKSMGVIRFDLKPSGGVHVFRISHCLERKY